MRATLMAPSDATVLKSALRRFQHRLRLMAFLRHLTVTCAIALGLFDILVMTARLQGIALRASAATAALAVLAAYALAVFKTPSLSATARIVDARFGLQDRAVSALQFAESADPIASLVVADAASRLKRMPVSRLPLTVPVTARWLAASVFLVSAVLLITTARSRPEIPVASQKAGTVGATSARSQRVAGRPVTPGAAAVAKDVTLATAATALPVPGQRGRDSRSSTAAENGGRGNADTSKDAAMDSGQQTTGPAPQSRGGAARQANGFSGRVGRKGGSAPGSSVPGLSAGGPGGSAPSTDESAGGGGVGFGVVVSDRPGTARPASPLAGARRSAAFAAAYARAESATPADRVPRELRSYVRAYFLAIRQGVSQ